MTVRAHKRKVIYVGLAPFTEREDRLSMMALDEPSATIAVPTGKVEATDLADQFPMPLHRLLALTLYQLAVALTY